MVFGEIVEPSTRALIDEDLDEYPEYTESVPEWSGISEPPENLHTLIFIETTKVRTLFQNCVLPEQKPITKILNAGIEVFHINTNKYVIVFSEKKEFTSGEITELFDEWIKRAKDIFAITSESINNYQNYNLREKPASLIKILSNDETKSFGYDMLESPNLVTGLGASVLSYSIHTGFKCNLFIVYVDTSPLDSLNMGPLISLLRKLDVPIKSTHIKLLPSSSNLYM